jgi:hypothetical protein
VTVVEEIAARFVDGKKVLNNNRKRIKIPHFPMTHLPQPTPETQEDY